MKMFIADTGNWARDVKEALEDGGITVDGFVEFTDKRNCDANQPRLKEKVIWWEDAIMYTGSHMLVHGLGVKRREEYISIAHSIGFKFATFVHPTSRVPKSCKLGYGVFIGPGVIMGSDCFIGNHVTINRGVIIGHDVVLKDFVNVSPGANIAGMVTVGKRTYVAMGAKILDTKHIGEDCIVGAGAVVTKNFGDKVQLIGMPAKVTKENIAGK